MTRKIQITLLIVLVLLLAIVVIFLEMPERTRFWMELFTAGHTLVFGLSSLAFLQLSVILLSGRINSRLTHYLVAFIAAAAVGVATEVIQHYVGRDCELADFLRDLLGAAAFLCVAMTFDSGLTWDFPSGRTVRMIVRIAAPVLILSIFWPALNWGGSYLYRDSRMPILISYDSPITRKFIRPSNCRLEITDPPVEWRSQLDKVVKLTFLPAIYPGVMFREMSPDWSGYREMQFGLFSERPDTFALELRINDRHHVDRYSDRFNTVLKVTPGFNQVSIPLEKLRAAPQGREMDLREMGTIILFASRPTDSFTVYLSELRLK
ncbi:MAG: VanZ family protein [candidate division Zixibacteria bacterium]|nr:VanZ family protein [candidate division Zixibacteria bacterium]